MPRELTSNVFVDGRWYGPAYGTAVPPSAVADKIEHEAAFGGPEAGFDLRFRDDDYAPDEAPNLASLAPAGAVATGTSPEALASMSPEDLAAYATARGIEDPAVGTKAARSALIAQLTGA